ncbi:MAG TPA: hypothetical protein DEO57_00130 [Phycisphaerales bacterium]|nr:hypothetical protein [Phycisphaerales bacterium]
MSIDRLLLRRISSLTLIAGCVLATGCEHEAARERAEVSQQLRDAEVRLMTSLNSGSDLEKNIQLIKGIRGGTKVQQATRDLMLATAELELAGIRTELMSARETGMRHKIGYVNTLIGNASALDHFINERNISAVDMGSDRLIQGRQALGARLSDVDRQVEMMQQPISEMEQTNSDQERRILDLRRAAESLRQEQYDLDPIEAFDVFQRSIEADRKANAIDLEMTNRQLILDLESKPIQDQARLARDHMTQILDEMESSNDAIMSMVALQTAQADAARALLQRTDEMITRTYEQMAEEDTGVMSADLQAISKMLESAANHARTGSRNVPRDGKNAATLLETQAQLDQLLLQSHRIRSLGERLELLNKMASSSFLSNRDSFSMQALKLEETIEQTRQMAIATGQSIEQTLRGVRGGEVDTIQNAVQQIVAGMGGPAAAPRASTSTSPDRGTTTTSVTAPNLVPGAATPQELVQTLNAIVASDTPLSDKMRSMSELTDMSSPEAGRFIQSNIALAQAFEGLKAAMESKFGSSQSPAINMMSMSMQLPQMDASMIQMDSDTTASIPVTNAMSQTNNSYMIKTASGWKLNIAMDLQRTPELQQMMQMVPAITKALNEITGKIRSGEIANGMGVDMAIGQAMGGIAGP